MVSLPENMKFVCEDAGPSNWMHDADSDVYFRVYPKTNEFSMISGKYLPDPEELLTNKIRKFSKLGVHVNIEAMKSTPAVYALWNHHKNIIDVNK